MIPDSPTICPGLLNDLMVLSAPRQLSWPTDCRADEFIDLYDWDHILLDEQSISILPVRILLCHGVFPCMMDIRGSRGAILRRLGSGSIVCLASSGCTGIILESLYFQCVDTEPSMSAFKIQGATITVTNSSFNRCWSHENGGIIQSFNLAHVNVLNSSFSDLHTTGFGGAISAFGSIVHTINSQFRNCSSEGGGGAIWATSYQCYGSEVLVGTSVYVDSSEFLGCFTSGSGGAVMASSDSPTLNESIFIEVFDSKFSGCTSSTDGGALYLAGNMVVATVLASVFDKCLSLKSGGALSANSGTLTRLLKSRFWNNSAYGLGGGALHSQEAVLSLVSSSFDWNRAPKGGGGLVYWEGHVPPQTFGWCPSGFWSVAELMEESSDKGCKACPAGTFQTGEGMISSGDCIFCDAGKYSSGLGATSTETCRVCSLGTYSSANGASESGACAFCDPGSFVEPGGTRCALCSEGKYSSSVNVTACHGCVGGTFSAIRGSNHSSSCKSCKPGTYSQAIASSCFMCSAGSFQTGSGMTNCDLCATGTYSSGHGMISVDSCQMCASGSYTIAEGSCGRFVPGGNYDNNENFVFIVPPGGAKSVTLYFTIFDTEAGYDWVHVYSCLNVSCVGATLLSSLTGNTLPPDQTSNTGIMKVVWSSDSAGSAQGWDATWVASQVNFGGQKCFLNSEVTNSTRRTFKTTSIYTSLRAVSVKNPPSQFFPKKEKKSETIGIGRRILSFENRNKGSLSTDVNKFLASIDQNRAALCGYGNFAVYGSCYASDYQHLDLFKLDQSDVFPGVPFYMTAIKKDAYNQTIGTDASSVLQIFQSANNSFRADPYVSIIGITIVKMEAGQVTFSIALKPTFSFLSVETNQTGLVSEPYIFMQGADSQSSSGLVMQSRALRIQIRQGGGICPRGSILSLDQEMGLTGPAVCTPCKAGTYSLNPLAGAVQAPSCLNCPAGGDCIQGGSSIKFAVGRWTVHDDKYYFLVSCPPGHQLINSTLGTSWGEFDHDSQQCKPCKENEYIIDYLHQCQSCPLGATCDGTVGSLVGLPGSYWRKEADKFRVFMCDPGYVLVRDDSENRQKAFLDSCVKCLPSKYSLTGAVVKSLAPCSWRGGTDQPYLCPQITQKDVVGYGDSTVNGSWTTTPDQALELCLKCPVGADCPGGSDLIPKEGFWLDIKHAASAVTARREVLSETLGVLKCPPRACQYGGNCTGGRTGPVCGICAAGWAMSSGTCMQCPQDQNADALKISVAIIGSLVLLALLYFFSLRPLMINPEKVSDEKDEDAPISKFQSSFTSLASFLIRSKEHLDRSLSRWGRNTDVLLFCQGYIKVIISFYQVVSTFSENYNIPWPSQSTQIFQVAAIFRFDLVAFPGITCLLQGISYTSKLLIYTLFPLVIILLLFIAPILGKLFSIQGEKRELVTNQFWYSLMFFLFLIYPTVSFQTLRSFNCQVVGKYGPLLIADLAEPCPYQYSETSTVRQAFTTKSFVFWWSLASSIAYPLGVPLFFLLVMKAYKIPELAQAKLKGAKIDALVIEYRKKAMPLEVEILIRQLKIGSLLPSGELLKQQIELLFTALARGEEELNVQSFVTFFQSPKLGFPDPDLKLIKELFDAKDTSGNGLLDKSEFLEMMQQLIFVHNLFTGHEAIDDMHFEQLYRLFEFHTNGKIYIEECEEPNFESRKSHPEKSVLLIFRDRNGQGVEKIEAKIKNGTTIFSINNVHEDVSQLLQRQTGELEYVGVHNLKVLEAALDREEFLKLQTLMEPDLKSKLLDIADSRVSMGSIVLPAMAWQRWDQDLAGGKLSQQQIDEDKAVQRMGFLMKNYDVRNWYFEITEMFRKLFMTSLITFIFPGTNSQITVALAVSTISLLHFLYSHPFLDKTIGHTQSYALLAICWTLLYGVVLAFQSDIFVMGLTQTDSEISTINAVAVFIVILNSGIIAFPIMSLLMMSTLTRRKRVIKAAARAGRRASMTLDHHQHLSFRSGRDNGTVGRDSRLWNISLLPLQYVQEGSSPIHGHGIGKKPSNLRTLTDKNTARLPSLDHDSEKQYGSELSMDGSDEPYLKDMSSRPSLTMDGLASARLVLSPEGPSGHSALKTENGPSCESDSGASSSTYSGTYGSDGAPQPGFTSHHHHDLIRSDSSGKESTRSVSASPQRRLVAIFGLSDSPAVELDGPERSNTAQYLPQASRNSIRPETCQAEDVILTCIDDEELPEIHSSAAPPQLYFQSDAECAQADAAMRLVLFGDA